MFYWENEQKIIRSITECESRGYLTKLILSNSRLKSDLEIIKEAGIELEEEYFNALHYDEASYKKVEI